MVEVAQSLFLGSWYQLTKSSLVFLSFMEVKPSSVTLFTFDILMSSISISDPFLNLIATAIACIASDFAVTFSLPPNSSVFSNFDKG